MAVKSSAAVDCGLVLGVVKIVRPVGRCSAVTMTGSGERAERRARQRELADRLKAIQRTRRDLRAERRR
jgi:hypothetical protein